MIVGAASMRDRPGGGPTALIFLNSSYASAARSLVSPLPNHCAGHCGTAQPESASVLSQSLSDTDGSQCSSMNALTALRT